MDAAMAQLSGDLIPKVRALCASVGRPGGSGPAPAAVPSSTPLVRSSDSPASRVEAVVIGVSTGGPNALAELIPSLPADLDRKSVVSGKSVSVRVDLGGRRILKKKN